MDFAFEMLYIHVLLLLGASISFLPNRLLKRHRFHRGFFQLAQLCCISVILQTARETDGNFAGISKRFECLCIRAADSQVDRNECSSCICKLNVKYQVSVRCSEKKKKYWVCD